MRRLAHAWQRARSHQFTPPTTSQPKKALATIGSGELAPVLDLVLPTFEAYAKRHNYRLVVGDGSYAQGALQRQDWRRIPIYAVHAFVHELMMGNCHGLLYWGR
jgi:hypothetical protein